MDNKRLDKQLSAGLVGLKEPFYYPATRFHSKLADIQILVHSYIDLSISPRSTLHPIHVPLGMKIEVPILFVILWG